MGNFERRRKAGGSRPGSRAAAPVAIVGAACRFPGAPDLTSLWEALRDGRDLVEASMARSPRPGGADPHQRLLDDARIRGVFLEDVDRFDAEFFGISRREAECMDPQQRLLLESAWHCLEDAGVPPASLAGSRTAVLVGVSHPDYAELMYQAFPSPEVTQLTGSYLAVAANRISFLLDLRGPSLALDSSCSSSLLAVHQAVRTLQSGDADAALVGGVNLCLHPGRFLSLEKIGVLSPDGRCRSLDAESQGFVRAEGVATVYLKPLDAALRDRDPIHAVIEGTASSHGGRTETMSLTCPEALTCLMQQALGEAARTPDQLGMLELHATGTSRGDAVELEAVAQLFRGAGGRRPRCLLGSVKTNLGHTESAAGLAGLLKAMLSIEHAQVPAHLHLRTPRVAGDRSAPIPRTTRAWPARPRRTGPRPGRYAGVTALGIGGAAAHVVLGQHRQGRPRDRGKGRDLLVLSARTEDQLGPYARRVLQALEAGDPRLTLRDLCYTSRVGRTAFPHRLAIVADSLKDLARKLRAYLAGEAPRRVHTSAASADPGAPAAPLDARGLRRLVAAERLTRIARHWVAGATVPWKRLRPRGKPRRVAFPGCPFAGERYWIPTVDKPAAPPPRSAPPEDTSEDSWRRLQGEVARLRADSDALDALGAELLMATFLANGAFGHDHDGSRRALQDRLGVRPAQGRLLEAYLDILARHGWVEGDGGERLAAAQGRRPRTPAEIRRELEAQGARSPGRAPHAALLAAVVPTAVGLLAGREDPMVHLFPDGSPEVVERIYRGQVLFDHCNRVTAAIVRQQASRARDRRLRVLELGAGSGATTHEVLAALEGHPGEVEYVYTDISRAFLSHGQRTFGARLPGFCVATLDLEAAPEAQGFEPGSFDLVLGTNVLHATRRIATTLDHARRLLRPGGTLVVNEILHRPDWLTLIFGGLQGWWLFEDAPLRRPHAPLLGAETWRRQLEAAGFEALRVHGFGESRLGNLDQAVFEVRAGQGPVRPSGGPAPHQEAVAPPPPAGEAPRGAPEASTTGYLRQVVARSLRCPAEELGEDMGLPELGLDSILSREVLYALERDLGKLPPFLLHENRTLRQLAAALHATPGAAEALARRSGAPTEEAPRPDLPGPEAPRPEALRPEAPRPEARPAEAPRPPPAEPAGYPLSENQKLLLLAYQMDPESTAYNVPLSLGLRNQVSAARLREALGVLVARYPVLSTRVVLSPDGPRQVLQDDFAIPLTHEDVGDIDDDALAHRLALTSLRPLPLVDHPLVQATLLRRHRRDHGLSLVLHHAICDGLTLNRLLDDLEALLGAPEPALPRAAARPEPGTASYRDFVEHQQAMLASPWAREAEAFWRRQLEGFAPGPGAATRVAGRVPTVTFSAALGAEGASGIARVAAALKVTPFAVVLAAYAVALARYLERRDVVVALPFAGRPEARFRDSFGYFVNLIPKRVRLDGDPTLGDLVRRLAGESLEALAYGEYPLYTMLDRLAPSLGLRAADLTGATFYFHNWMRGQSTQLARRAQGHSEATAPEDRPTTSSIPGSFMAGEFDMTLEIYPVAEWKMVCKFNPARHERVRMEGLMADVRALLDRLVAAPSTPLSACLEGPLTGDWAASVTRGAVAELPGRNALEVLREVVRRQPDRPAVLAGPHTQTFAQLWDRVTRVAAQLRAGGIGPGKTVALSLRRDEAMPGLFLGVLLSGARFVPLDPSFPRERRRMMSEVAAVDGILVDPADRDSLLPDGGRDLSPLLAVDPPPGARVDPEDIAASAEAYILFTSGSTGRPKGARISHGALVNSLYFTARALGVTEADCFAFTTSINFDPFLTECLGPLLVGASVEVFPEGIQRDGIALAEALDASRATFFQATPTSYRSLLAGEWTNPRRLALLTGGEALTWDLAGQLMPLTDALWNLYGPVESTVWTSVERVRPFQALGLGRPIANVEYFVLDERQVPVPRGVEGELHIGGLSLGEGYAGLPEGAPQGYQPDPTGLSRTGRLYRTGDRVVLTADDTLLFQGRADFQVKYRGRRIELEEIEASLRSCEGVDDAGVVVRGGGDSDYSELVAFVLGAAGLSPATLREHLERSLPAFMVPERIQRLERFPKTLSLKLDRRALAERPWEALLEECGSPGQAPTSPRPAPTPAAPAALVGSDTIGLIEALREIAEEVVPGSRTTLGPRSVLGSSGFDSIRLTRFSVEIQKRLGLRVQPAQMFEHRTLERLAEHLSRRHPGLGGPGPAPRAADAAEPIAITGMAGRMPGGRDLGDFWRVLRASEDQITEIPPERWDWRDHYGEGAPETRRGSSKWGGFSRDLDRFDPRFFGIAPAEARMIDPQQRLFLQHAWEALEDAGIRPGSLRGTATGVFVAVSFSDYSTLVVRQDQAGNPLSMTGSALTVIPNRLSYLLDLRGVSTTVDTACSSSLVAVHRAVECLRRGEIDTAIVGATNLLLDAGAYVAMGRNGMLSPTGRCRTFDHRADGYVRGEGVGVLVLQRLSRAERGGHPIHAVLRASAENHGGHASSLTAPNPEAQRDLLLEAYRAADLDPRTLGFLETHGTGTRLGDPIETGALVQAFEQLYADRGLPPPAAPHCALGAVKSTVGHLEAAAGMAGLMKTLLAMRHRTLPPNLHLERQNPMVELAGSPFRLLPSAEPWAAPRDQHGRPLPRRAGVSSFGFGGSNAHVVVEEYPAPPPPPPDPRPQLILLSARNPERLRDQARALAAHLEATPDLDLGRLAYTLQEGREHFECRWFTVAASQGALRAALGSLAEGGAPAASPLRFDTFLPERGPVRPLPQDLEGDRVVGLEALGQEWLRGADFDWASLHEPAARRHLRLPTYAFARESYWLAAPPAASAAAPAPAPAAPEAPEGDMRPLHFRLHAQDPVIHQHRVGGRPVCPGVYQLRQLLLAARARFPGRPLVLREVLFARPLVLDAPTRQLEVRWTRRRGEALDFELHDADDPGAAFTSGTLLLGAPRALPPGAPPAPTGSGEPVAPAPLYRAARQLGIDYGPAFQVLQAAQREPEAVHAHLALAGDVLEEPGADALHPCLLDGALQVVGPLLPSEVDTGPRLPFFLEEFFLAEGTARRVRAVAWRDGPDLSCQLESESGARLALIRGLQSRPVPGVRAPDPAPEAPRAAPPAGGAPLEVPVPGQVAPRFAELERLGRRRLRDRLEALGLFGALERTASLDELRRACGVLPDHRRLFHALLEILVADGVLMREPGGYRRTPGALPPPAAGQDAGVEDDPFGRLLLRCLDGLGDVLTGARRATEVLFPGGDTRLVADTYGDNDLKQGWHQALAEAIERQVRARRARDPGCSLRILEAGAGTGSSTRRVLERLEHHAPGLEVVFTDLSPLFVKRARAALCERFPFVSFQVLDLERPPAAQGLAPGSFDLVFATDAVHATRRIAESLENLRALLGDQGVLLLHESTRTSEYGTLTFGLTDGWWRFEDEAVRLPHSPLLSAGQWLRSLGDAGFRGATWLAVPEGETADPGRVLIHAQAAAAGRDAALEERLTRLVAGVLELDPAELDPEANLERYGLDSLMVLEVTRTLRTHFIEVPATLLFERTTLRSLARWFAAHAPEARAEAPVGTAPPPPDPTPAPAPAPRRAAPSAAHAEPIAIIGMSGRYPMARDLDEFWENLASGRHCISEIPPERWDWRQDFDPDGRGERASYTRWGGFLADADRFDPLFFRISPRVADSIDPQERIFLECAWSTLEDAGYRPEALAGPEPSTGVFVGVMNQGYSWLGISADAAGVKNAAGGGLFSVANRVSFCLDLQGPSMAVDTACSSSLSAIHLACQSLRARECQVALAGGVNLIVHSEQMRRMASASMLSRDDRCKAFSRHADGFVDGEGVGAVLLKPLDDALRDGDRIHAVLRGSALNAGGRSNGYTVPNPRAQAAVIQRALAAAGVPPGSIEYVEAHGTGTPLGDPLEMRGLVLALDGEDRESECRVGSVKPNIGHLESAAGIAGLTKVVLQMQRAAVAPSLFSDEPNPEIPFESIPFRVPQTLEPWEAVAGRPRRAGLSSFGAGGANAHVVVEEFRHQDPPPATGAGRHLLPLSARSAERLQVYARTMAAHLGALARPGAAGELPDATWFPPLRDQVAAALDIPPELLAPELLLAELNPGVLGWQRLRAALQAERGAPLSMATLTGARDLRDLSRRLQGSAGGVLPATGDTPAAMLARVAWTLQRGRVELDHRLAVVATSLEDAAAQLAARAAGDFPSVHEAARQLPPSALTPDRMASALGQGDLETLARAWTGGASIDWGALHPGSRPRPVSLPTYPFERLRCWAFDELLPASGPSQAPAARPPEAPVPAPHPRLPAPPQAGPDGTLTFRGHLDPADQLVREHRLQGAPTLPGTAYLDLVFAGARHLNPAPVTLESLVLLAPMRVPEGGLDFRLTVTPRPAGRYDFELRSGPAPGTRHGEGWFHFPPAPAAPPADRGEPRGPGVRRPDPEARYAAIEQAGFVSYGPSYRGLRQLALGPEFGLGHLVFDPARVDGLREVTLPPQVLDCAVQVAGAMSTGETDLVPFAFEAVVQFAPLTPQATAHVRRIQGEVFEVILRDAGGQALLRIGRCSLRPLRSPTEQDPTGVLYAPTWAPWSPKGVALVPEPAADSGPAPRVMVLFGAPSRPLAEALAAAEPGAEVTWIELAETARETADPRTWVIGADESDGLDTCLAGIRRRLGAASGRERWQIYFLGAFETQSSLDDPDRFEAGQQAGVWSLLRLIQGLHRHGFEDLGLTVVTNRVQAVFAHQAVFPAGATAAGIAKTLRHELPEYSPRLVDLALDGDEPPEVLAAVVERLRAEAQVAIQTPGAVALRDGVLYEQRFDEIHLLPAPPDLRPQLSGTHLIVGGAGGIGRVLADHLLATTDAEVHLTGRRPAADDLGAAIRASQGRLHYHRVDATDAARVEELLQTLTARRGRLNSVFMSAMSLEDRALLKMTPESFGRVLAPKVQGSRVLLQALASRPPRHLVFFSSAVSYSGSPGQSNYVAGNCFQDSLARHARRRLPDTRVRTINWGFWGEVGAVAKDEYRERMRQFGVVSIATSEGMDLIERALSQPLDQAYVIKGKALRDEIRRFYRHALRPASDAVPRVLAGAFDEIEVAS